MNPRTVLPLPRGMKRSCSPLTVCCVFLALCTTPFINLSAEANEPALAQDKSGTHELNVTALIDAKLRTAWEENELRPSREASDSEWCRRVFLDLIGRIPTVQELQDFQQDKSRDKKRQLVERLLGSEYLDEFTEYWTSYWANTLVGRTGGQGRRTLINRTAFEEYLERVILEAKPYDEFVKELLTATGSADPAGESFNPATNYLVEKLAEDGIQATAKTAEIFLGTAVQCTQCHNHPFNEYRQNQFWEMNAFFRQAQVRRPRDPNDEDRRIGMIENRDFAGQGRRLYRDDRSEIMLTVRNGQLIDRDAASMAEAPIFYELRNGQVQVAYPVFIDGTALIDEFADQGSDYGNSGYLEHVDRREELARLLVDAREFDMALMNRLWAHFFGYGFTKPIHDMGPHNPASHPELLDELGIAFRDSGFNLRQAMRWIVMSEAYGLSSKVSSGNRKDDPALGVAPQFSRFYVRQMQPEQLYESLLAATKVDETVDENRQSQMKSRWLRQFTTNSGTDDGAETTTFNGSIPQTLMMMNGDLMRRACTTNNGSFLDRVANDNRLTNRDKINYLYQAALSRKPTGVEIKFCNELLASRRGNVVGTLQDIWWAMLNSNEFILIH